jgi:hypothetical protein
MIRLIKDANTIWEDLGQIKLFNFPPEKGTYPYLVKVFREYKRGRIGWREVDGDPIYFEELPSNARFLANLFGQIHNTLLQDIKVDLKKLSDAEYEKW